MIIAEFLLPKFCVTGSKEVVESAGIEESMQTRYWRWHALMLTC